MGLLGIWEVLTLLELLELFDPPGEQDAGEGYIHPIKIANFKNFIFFSFLTVSKKKL